MLISPRSIDLKMIRLILGKNRTVRDLQAASSRCLYEKLYPAPLRAFPCREARQSRDGDEVKQSKEHETVIVPTNALYDRNEEIQKLVAKHPGLTPEKAEQGLRESGF